MLEIDKRHIWHPFTIHGAEPDPVVVAAARNASLYDENGREILDLVSSWWTCVHGHAHPRLNRALSEQAAKMEHVMFAGFTHPPAIELAHALAAILPGDLNRVFYSDDGSTSVEVALKAAFQYWQNLGEPRRTRFLAFEGAYHGDTVGAMSLGRGSGFFRVYQDLLFQVETLPFPHTWEGDRDVAEKEDKAVSALRASLEAGGRDTAALIVEPLMQGASGIRLCRPEFVGRVAEAAREFGVLVIFDEVAVGFGRSGSMFACEKADVVPDIICLSKGLTAGYMPMSATVVRDRIFEAFLGGNFASSLAHGHSFTANPLACAVALESLKIFAGEQTLQKVARIEEKNREFLKTLEGHPLVSMPRAMGGVCAFNLAGEGTGYKSGAAEWLRSWYISHGLNLRPLNGAVYLMPPYCITAGELDRAYSGIREGLDLLESRRP